MIIKNFNMRSFYNNEDEVKQDFNKYLTEILEVEVLMIYDTDGIFSNHDIKMLCEYKCKKNIQNENTFYKVICQVLFYLHNNIKSIKHYPDTIFIGTDTLFCYFDSSILDKYLSLSLEWRSQNPSSAFDKPPKILMDNLSKDKFGHNIPRFSISDQRRLENLKNISNKGIKMPVDNNNIKYLYKEFLNSKIIKKKLTDHLRKWFFLNIIFGTCNDEYNNKNERIDNHVNITMSENSNNVKVLINRDNYEKYKSSVKIITKPSEKVLIISQIDRLIKLENRRNDGEFYTPPLWVNKAYQLIDKTFGYNWKNEYVVWDPCCGTGNLTRDYSNSFKSLYCSTLQQSDIDIMFQNSYNPNAVKFQYDFLNDDVMGEALLSTEPDILFKKAPDLYKSLTEGEKVIIIMNPPYRDVGGGKKTHGINSNGSNGSKIKELMSTKKYGIITNQLVNQFLFRVMLLKKRFNNNNIYIASFGTHILLKASVEKFRKDFNEMFFNYDRFVFGLNEFSDTGDNCIVSFDIFKPGKEENNEFPADILINQGGIITKQLNKKLLYSVNENDLCKNWGKPIINNQIKIKYPAETTGLRISDKFQNIYFPNYGHIQPTRLAWDCFNTFISTLPNTTYRGYIIDDTNFEKCISMWSSMLSYKPNWLNRTDEFIKPNINHPEFKQWADDSLVSVLFNRQSLQTSIRNKIPNNLPPAINHFFWMSSSEIKDLADENGFDELYQDVLNDNDRLLFNKLQLVNLSDDAKNILQQASDLIRITFPKREKIHKLHPEWHLNAWDAGWKQIVYLLQDLGMKNELKIFRGNYNSFISRMSEGIYKFGFLK